MKTILCIFLWLVFACVNLLAQPWSDVTLSQPEVAAGASSPTPDILWWKLNEGSGAAIVSSSTDTSHGGTTDAAWVTGKSGSGGALDFIPANSDDAATTNTINYAAAQVITVSWWCYPDATSSTFMMLESGNPWYSAEGRWQASLDNNFTVSIKMETGRRTETATAPPTGAWVHYLVVYNGSTSSGNITVYTNGVEQATSVVESGSGVATAFATETLNVGSRGSASLFYDGRLDDIRIYAGDQSANVTSIRDDPQ